MAHFAELNENNIVTRVIVIHNNELLVDGVESESRGIDFCKSLYGGRWVQTSYNGNIRKNFAGIDFYFDETRDAFISPKPYDSWIFIENSCQWEAPIPYPTDGKPYRWDETSVSWVKFSF
jgi:hypothetical protein